VEVVSDVLSLVINAVPEMIARTASIIELGIAPADQPTIAGLIDRLGMGERLSAFEWDREVNWIRASDGRTMFSANEISGGLRYKFRPLEEEPGTDVTSAESRLEQIARGFLVRMERPLEPLALQAITYLRTETQTPTGEVAERATLDAGLIFKRTVDELPVIGPGGTVMIKIGTDETVTGGREIWRPLVRRGEAVSLRAPDEAIDLLRQRLRNRGLDGVITVRNAALGYGELGIESQQKFLEPCYAFELVTSGPVQSKKIEVIPAARVGRMAESLASA
jgi:hypothetical protein